MEKYLVFKSSNEAHCEVLLYVFMCLIQSELNEFRLAWNSQNVRQSAWAPGGRPDILYFCPPVDFSNKGFAVGENDIAVAEGIMKKKPNKK